MKYSFYLLFLFTVISYSQTEKQLIEDNCNCIKTIDKNLSQDQKKRLIMDCSLKAFKRNRSYTEKVVKDYTGKNYIDGNDVFNYLQNVFDYTMTNNCEEYKDYMAEILGAKSTNLIVNQIGSQVCAELNGEYSNEIANSTIDRITKEKSEEIIKEFGETYKEEYKKELNLYLFYYCDTYRLNSK